MAAELDTTHEMSFINDNDNVEKFLYRFTLFSLSAYVKKRGLLPEKAFRKARIEGHDFWLFDKEEGSDAEKFHYSVVALTQLFRKRTISGLTLITYDDKTKDVIDMLHIDYILPDNSDVSTTMSNSSTDNKESALKQLYKIAAMGGGLADVERLAKNPFKKMPFITVNYKPVQTDEVPLCYVPATPERQIYNLPRDMETFLVATLDAGDGNQVVVTYETNAFFQPHIEDILTNAYAIGNRASLNTVIPFEPFMASPLVRN
uniref:HORMA domain-containing protein n=1 Tax=Panagrellus redivivus TaxID=6233 RepID=A0A7E4VIW1_PANRE